MTKVLGIVSAVVLAACSSGDDLMGDAAGRGPGGGASTATTLGGAGSGAAGERCPDGLAPPTSIATDAAAADLVVVAGAVYFRSGGSVVRVGADGSGRTSVYTSKDLVRAFTDGKSVVAVESPNPPDADVKVAAIGASPDNVQDVGGDNLVAAGIQVFGADATHAYLVGDKDDGDVLYSVGIGPDGGGLNQIAQTKGVITDPQLAGGALWYVLDQTMVYKLTVGGDAPALVATIDGGCSLAVGASRFFCTSNGVVSSYDLAGGGAKKVADATTSKVPLAFAAGITSGDTLVARSPVGSSVLKNVLRAVGSSSADTVIACGRERISDVATDGTTVAWIEPGRGVFARPLK